MAESNDTSGAFNWGSALNTILDTGASVVKASVDKPISNSVQTQPVNQQTPAAATSQAVAVTQGNPMKWVPYAIGGGLLLVGLFFVVAMKNTK